MTTANQPFRFFRRLPTLLLAAAATFFAGALPCHAESRITDMWWAPAPVTQHGHEIDKLLMFIFWLTLAVFVITQIVYAYFIIKYRYRKGVKAVYSHGNNSLELVWTAIPAVVFVMLAIFSNRLWLQLRSKAPGDSIKIDLVAYQFGFHIRQPGADKMLGASSLAALKKGENNFGIDAEDPAGFDDFTEENHLLLPVGRPVNVILRSQDVIHAFYIPEFRVYQDMVPGKQIEWMWFVPEQTGHWAIACNQLCGVGHYNMQAKVDVVTPEEYDRQVAKNSQEALKKHAEKASEAKSAQQVEPVATPAAPIADVAAVKVAQ